MFATLLRAPDLFARFYHGWFGAVAGAARLIDWGRQTICRLAGLELVLTGDDSQCSFAAAFVGIIRLADYLHHPAGDSFWLLMALCLAAPRQAAASLAVAPFWANLTYLGFPWRFRPMARRACAWPRL